MAAKTKKKAGVKKAAGKKPIRSKPGKSAARSKPKAATKKAATKKAATKKAATKKAATKKAATKKATTKKAATRQPAVALKPANKGAATAKMAKKPAAAESLEIRTILPASPERVLAAWLDSAEHSAFTGSDAAIDARVGGKHSAWNGYIEGEILEIQDGRRVVMSWRTTEFDAGQPDSIVVVEAHPHAAGTELRVVHTELPKGGAEKYGQGWREFYFVPMASHFRK